jgi:electron-transferring-flavoprotein dehydrogenase
MDFDVIIVGGGPAGLSAAIRLKQLAQAQNKSLSVCILEKGAQIGSHILSGAALDPRSLKSLLPNIWQQAPLDAPIIRDGFYVLTKQHAIPLPTPKPMQNHGNYLVRLGNLCEFLAKEAERLGCEIYPGFPATELLFNEQNQVVGVKTGDVGLDRTGQQKDQFQPGMALHAKYTLFAEGCRGQLSEQLIQHYHLREHAAPQTYGLGIKELWQIKPSKFKAGTVLHTVGWPLDHATYGGSFIYFLNHDLLAIGLIVGLDYQNPYLSPFEEFQRFKTHPWIKPMLKEGERIAYGARALNEGGWQSIPKLTFPGGALIGDAAGFLNVPQIKGIHNAMQSGMFAAETCFQALDQPTPPIELLDYPNTIKQSWVGKALYAARNVRPGFRFGLFPGLINAAFETYITRGKSPWTFSYKGDYLSLKPASKNLLIHYPKPDGVFTFDRLSSVYLTNTFHEENQPCHLKLKDPALAIQVNYREYASPETRYCPAAVYEIVEVDNAPHLQINAQNCIHCKTCDIKDPRQNIVWMAPEGGGGPNYSGM